MSALLRFPMQYATGILLYVQLYIAQYTPIHSFIAISRYTKIASVEIMSRVRRVVASLVYCNADTKKL